MSRPLWSRIRLTLEAKLVEVDELKLAQVRCDAAYRHMVQEHSVVLLEEQDRWGHKCRELELAVASRDACIAKLQRRMDDLQESHVHEVTLHLEQLADFDVAKTTAYEAMAKVKRSEVRGGRVGVQGLGSRVGVRRAEVKE